MQTKFQTGPRERLIEKGASSLTDAELLAILIKTGTHNRSALDIATELLARYGTLAELVARDTKEIQMQNGMGRLKAVTIAAAAEIGRRLQIGAFDRHPTVKSPEDVAALFIPRLRGLRKEQFHVALLSSANKVFRTEMISEGSLNASIVHPREVFRLAVIESAASIILLHNHPSGSLTPSNEDIAITEKLVEAGKIFGIAVYDHLIIAGDEFTSLRQQRKCTF